MQYLKLTETLRSVVVFPAADKNAWFEGFVESIPVVVNASSKLAIIACKLFYLLKVFPGSAVNVIESNLNIPLLAVLVRVPESTGVYVSPVVEDTSEIVAVEVLSDPTYCPNSSTRAMYMVGSIPPLCWETT